VEYSKRRNDREERGVERQGSVKKNKNSNNVKSSIKEGTEGES
jgi:hypothetical protein